MGWGSLLGGAGAALALMVWGRGGKTYEWGEADAEGLSVGLHVPDRKLPLQGRVQWQMAIKNASSRERRIIVENDLDPRPRCRLSATPADGGPAQEFEPASRGPATTGNISRTVSIPAGKIAELDLETATLTPGKYRLKAVYGGDDFTVRLESGAIDITVE